MEGVLMDGQTTAFQAVRRVFWRLIGASIDLQLGHRRLRLSPHSLALPSLAVTQPL